MTPRAFRHISDLYDLMTVIPLSLRKSGAAAALSALPCAYADFEVFAIRVAVNNGLRKPDNGKNTTEMIS